MVPPSPTQRIVGSYSFFSELENCPRKAYETRVARSIQREESVAQRWGNYVHNAMEKRIGEGKPLDEDVARFEQYATVFDGRGAATEAKLCIDKRGLPIKWYGEGAYVAGKIDVVLPLGTHVDVTDWKTGKDTYETPFELELHALLHAASVAPARYTYSGRYAYIGRDRLPDKIGQTYDLSDVGATWAKVNSLMLRAYGYQSGGRWPEHPNPLCGWCPVLQCRHNKVKQREGGK